MMAVAPNLTVLLGEFVGARLVAQAGKRTIIFSTSFTLDLLKFRRRFRNRLRLLLSTQDRF